MAKLTSPDSLSTPVRISIVVVSHNRIQLLRRCLASLADGLDVLVVDNGSEDGSSSLAPDFPFARFIPLPRNFGLTKALNIGIRACDSEYIMLLHEDTVITAAGVIALADLLDQRPDVGAVCPLLTNAAGQPTPQARAFPNASNPDPPLSPAAPGEEIACASGAAIMVRGFFLKALTKIDERYGNYGSGAELSMQVRRSAKKIMVHNSVRAIHESKSDTDSLLAADRENGIASFLGKHSGFVPGLLYRTKAALKALAGFKLGQLKHMLSGQKIDGSQLS